MVGSVGKIITANLCHFSCSLSSPVLLPACLLQTEQEDIAGGGWGVRLLPVAHLCGNSNVWDCLALEHLQLCLHEGP